MVGGEREKGKILVRSGRRLGRLRGWLELVCGMTYFWVVSEEGVDGCVGGCMFGFVRGRVVVVYLMKNSK